MKMETLRLATKLCILLYKCNWSLARFSLLVTLSFAEELRSLRQTAAQNVVHDMPFQSSFARSRARTCAQDGVCKWRLRQTHGGTYGSVNLIRH